MKSFTTTLLLAVGAASTVYAEHGTHARHKDLHARQLPAYMAKPHPPPSGASSCGCYSYTTTWYGAPTFIPDLGDYTNTTSAGWETVAPVATSTSTTCTDEKTAEPTPTSSTRSEIKEWGKYAASSVKVKKVSTSTSVATSSQAQASSYASPSSSSAASSTTSSTSSSASASATNSIQPNGDKWAFCYTPYANDGNCKTADAVASDVAGIKAKGFTSIRLYATDCDGPQNVGAAAAKEGLKLILGIWVDESGIGANTDKQVETLTAWGKDQWDLVEMVVAGNEAMFYGYTSAEGLAAFVNDVRSKFRAAGYNGPVGTSEVPGTFIGHADVLCPAVDYAAANIHPFFDTSVSAEGAGDYVVMQLDNVAKACGYKMEAYNLESGWPSLGSPNGLAIPGAEDQKVAIKSIMEKAGGKTAIFSYENDSWKAPGEFGVEQHWGCADLFD